MSRGQTDALAGARVNLASRRRVDRLVVFIAAFALLLGLSVAYRHRSDTLAGLIDEAEYNRLALDLLTGRGYDSTYWLPAFPAFVAVIYAIFGRSLLAVYAAHAVLWAVCLFLVHSIAARTTRNRTTALVALLMCAVWWPFYTNLIPRMMTEMLASVTVAGAILACMQARSTRSVSYGLITGLLIGIGALTKSVVLVFLPLAAAHVGWGDKRGARAGALVCLGCVLAVGPWIWRNYRVTGELVPVSTGGGYNFWFGNHPEVYRRRVTDARQLISEVQWKLEGKTDVARDRVFLRLAWARIKRHPAQAAVIFVQKFSKLWLGKLGMSPKTAAGPIRSIGEFGVPPGSLARLVLFCLAVLGWFALPGDARRASVPLAAVLVVWTLCYVLLTAEPRYAYPVQFYEIILAAAAVTWVSGRLLRRKPRPFQNGEAGL